MVTRFSFATNPRVVMGNGLQLPSENTPSILTMRTFFIELLECIFLAVNPSDEHSCKGICSQTLQVLIYKDGSYAKELVSR